MLLSGIVVYGKVTHKLLETTDAIGKLKNNLYKLKQNTIVSLKYNLYV